MKEPLSFEVGRVTESTQGRDKGRNFIIIEVVDSEYVLLADGLTHRLSAPKKKKIKHLHARPVMIDLKTIRPEGGKIQDSDLTRALEQNGFEVRHPLCKEV